MFLKPPNDPLEKNLYIFRFVTIGWLIAFYLKLPFFAPYLFGVITEYPVVQTFFPSFFRHPLVAQCAFLLPCLSVMTIFIRTFKFCFLASILMTLAASVLLLHSDTYNDMTFLTCFWSGIWLVWFSSQLNETHEGFYQHASFLAKSIVGFIFLGGFMGKCTPEYFNGNVFYQIFFIQKPHWPFTLMTFLRTAEEQRIVFAALARMIILTEGLLVLSPFMPNAVIGRLGPVLILSITLFSSWPILSVILPLMFLLWACLLIDHTD